MLLGYLAPKINTLELPGDRTSVEVQFKPIFKESLSITKKIHREFAVNNNGDILFNVEYNLKITNPSIDVIDYLFELDGVEVVFYPHSDGGGRYNANLSIVNQNKNNKYFIEELLLKIRATEYVSALRVISTSPICGSATHRITDDITVDFNYDLDELTFTNSTVRLYHLNDLMVIEDVPFTLSVLANRLTINPNQDLEEIEEYFIFIDSSVMALNTVNLRADFLCVFTTRQRARFPESFIIDEQSDIVNMIEGIDTTPILVENPKHGIMFCEDSWILNNPEQLSIVNINPDDDSTGVSISEQITIEFNKPLNIGYVTNLNVVVYDDFSNEYISGTLSIENLNKTIRFIPTSLWLSNRRYSFYITEEITDIFGMSLGTKFEYGFTTAVASNYSFIGAWTAGKNPYFVLGSDLVNYELRDYSIISSIDLSNFSNNRTDRLEWIDRIWPEQQTDDGIVTNLMSDCSHNAWFTNDDSALITLSSFPYGGQTNIPVGQKLHVIFNKIVLPSSVKSPYIRLLDVELGTTVTITFIVNGNSAIITPSSNLMYNKLYNLLILSYIDDGIREDILDRYLTQDYSFTFRTEIEIEKSIWVNDFSGSKIVKINSLNMNKVNYGLNFTPRGLLVECSDNVFSSSDAIVFYFLNTSIVSPFYYTKNLTFYIAFNNVPNSGAANYFRVKLYVNENYSDFVKITNYTYTYVDNFIKITLDMSNISLFPYSKFRVVIDQDFCDEYLITLQSAVNITYDIYNETDSEDDSYIIGQGLMTAIPTPIAYTQQYKYNMNFIKTDWQYDVVNSGEFHADGFGWTFASYCKGAWIFTDIPWHCYIDTITEVNKRIANFYNYPDQSLLNPIPFDVLFIGHSSLDINYHFNFPDEIGAAIVKISTVMITDNEALINEAIEEIEVIYEDSISKPFPAVVNQIINPTVLSKSGFYYVKVAIGNPAVNVKYISGLRYKIRIKIELSEDLSIPSLPEIPNFAGTYKNKTYISNESYFVDNLYALGNTPASGGDDYTFMIRPDESLIGLELIISDEFPEQDSHETRYGYNLMRFGFYIMQFYDTTLMGLTDTWNFEIRDSDTNELIFEERRNDIIRIGEIDEWRFGDLIPELGWTGSHYVKLTMQPFVPRITYTSPLMYSTKDPSIWTSKGFGGTQPCMIPPPPVVTLNYESIDFETVAIGVTKVIQLIIIMAYITSPLTITISTGFTGSQVITINPQPNNGLSLRRVDVSFTAVDANPVYGTITITGGGRHIGYYGVNILDERRNIDITIPLQANSVPSPLYPEVVLSDDCLWFYNCNKNQLYTQQLTLDFANITEDISITMNNGVGNFFNSDIITITDRGTFQKVLNITFLQNVFDDYMDLIGNVKIIGGTNINGKELNEKVLLEATSVQANYVNIYNVGRYKDSNGNQSTNSYLYGFISAGISYTKTFGFEFFGVTEPITFNIIDTVGQEISPYVYINGVIANSFVINTIGDFYIEINITIDAVDTGVEQKGILVMSNGSSILSGSISGEISAFPITEVIVPSVTFSGVVDFGTLYPGESSVSKLNLYFKNINSDVTVVVSAGFSGDITYTDLNSFEKKLDITFNPLIECNITGTVTISGGGIAIPVVIPLSGIALLSHPVPTIIYENSIAFVDMYIGNVGYKGLDLNCSNITAPINVVFSNGDFLRDITIRRLGDFWEIYTIKFKPTSAGLYSETVTITGGSTIPGRAINIVIPITANVFPYRFFNAPIYEIFPKRIDFEDVVIGNSVTKRIKIGMHFVPLDITIDIRDNFGAPYNNEFTCDTITISDKGTSVTYIEITYTPTVEGFAFGIAHFLVRYADELPLVMKNADFPIMLSGKSGNVGIMQQPILQKINNTIVMSSEFIAPVTINKVNDTIEMS